MPYQSEGKVQVKSGGEGDRFGMDADGAGLRVGDCDDVGGFDVFVVQNIQDGKARFDVISLDAVPVNKGQVQPAVRVTFIQIVDDRRGSSES